MNVKAFLMNNVPREDDLLMDFVEGYLNVGVIRVEFIRDAALVTLATSINFAEAAKVLKENQSDIDGLVSPLEVVDAGQCGDKVVVADLDDDYLSLQFLKLYIESTFADGNDVVSECKALPIPEYNWTVLSLTDPTVVTRILEKEDHIPLPSENYHIQIQPFYQKIYSLLIENPTHYIVPSEDASPSIEEKHDNKTTSEAGQSTSASEITGRMKGHEYMDIDGSVDDDLEDDTTDHVAMKMEPEEMKKKKDSLKDSNNSKAFASKVEEEALSMPKEKYKLLKDRLKSLTCQLNYSKKEERLSIKSTDVIGSKSHIIDLALSVNRSSVTLSEDQAEFLQKEKVKSIVKNFVEENNSKFKIDDDFLSVWSLGNSDDTLKRLTDRVLCTKKLPVPEGVPRSKIRECNTQCKNYLVLMKYNDGNSISLTGLVEDVSLAADDVKQMMDDFKCFSKTFKLNGKDACFVNRHKMKELRDILRDADATMEVVNDDEISIQYRCTKLQVMDLDQRLTDFKGSIEKSRVDVSNLGKEDLALVRRNLKTNSDFIEHFQTSNKCCVVYDDFKETEFFDASAASGKGKERATPSASGVRRKRPRVPHFHSKQKRVQRLPSCTLQIKPFGNIAREKTDLLVCGVEGSSLNLNKTKVGQAFLKLDNGLQNQMGALSFSANGVSMNQRNLPKTKCKAFAFITLEGWQAGVSDQQLKAAVTEVLDTANQLGITSVSFPPLGYGRAFKFPTNEASQAVIGAIESFLKTNKGNSKITLINCLAPDRYLYNAMNKEVDVVFKGDKTRSGKGADDDSSDDDDDDDGGAAGGEDDEEEEGAAAFQNSSGEDGETSDLEMEALDPDSPLSIVIVHFKLTNITSKFKSEIAKKWLYEDSFKSDKIKCISPQFMKDVIQIAKVLGVWVRKKVDPNTKNASFKIKGRPEDVYKMKTQLSDKVIEMIGTSNQSILSPFAPKRGTKEFMKHATTCIDSVPSYWTSKSRGHGQLVSVDEKTTKAISDLIEICWEQQFVGQGNDAAGIPTNSRIKVMKVERLENHSLFLRYSSKRKAIFRDMSNRGSLSKGIGKLNGSKGPTTTMQLSRFMRRELFFEINELYLFHGTKSDILSAICEQGIDNRLSSASAMFGQGVYMAESSTKSDQYADTKGARVPHGTNLTMLLTRAVLGDVFLCDHNHESVASKTSQKLRRPPCTVCYKDMCRCAKPLFHSVMGDGKWLFREFVVYHSDQCYPEYFITYQRY